MRKLSKWMVGWIGGWMMIWCWIATASAGLPENVNGVYLTALSVGERKVTEIIHYIEQAKMNAVVIHVKDPFGRIYWQSGNPRAKEMDAIYYKQPVLERALERFKAKKIYTIAKIDVFFDSLLTKKYPEFAVKDTVTGGLWADRKGMHWLNPYDKRVWEYVIDLSKELAFIGFDEIQFDYIRFPSDGVLSRIRYPMMDEKLTKPCCIGEFLKTAYSELKPLGVNISADVFGLTVWETKDFGVGQVLEAIDPHVDAVCPMLYPSHFPLNYGGVKKNADYPFEIMKQSMEKGKQRSNKLRAWVQGFWYKPEEINAQLDGLAKAGFTNWLMWNPASNYTVTYEALSKRLNVAFTEPSFYPSIEELQSKENRIIKGNFRTVNFTDYKQGYSILSIDIYKQGLKNSYIHISDVLGTMDEAVMDHILSKRNQKMKSKSSSEEKKMLLVNLISKDLGIAPKKIPVSPIYIDWKNDCRFSTDVPKDRLEAIEPAKPSAENLRLSRQ